jgi:hypothetical protein
MFEKQYPRVKVRRGALENAIQEPKQRKSQY